MYPRILPLALVGGALLTGPAIAVAADGDATKSVNQDRATPRLQLFSPEQVAAQPEAAAAAEGAQNVPPQLTTAWRFLSEHAADYGLTPDLSNLEHVATTRTLLGTTLRFKQLLGGQKVEGGEIVVSVNDRNQVYQVYNTIYPVPANKAARATAVQLSRDKALDVAWAALGAQGFRDEPIVKLKYLPIAGGDFVLTYDVRLYIDRKTMDGATRTGLWQVLVDAVSGKVVGDPTGSCRGVGGNWLRRRRFRLTRPRRNPRRDGSYVSRTRIAIAFRRQRVVRPSGGGGTPAGPRLDRGTPAGRTRSGAWPRPLRAREAAKGHRHGRRPRQLVTTFGPLELSVPRGGDSGAIGEGFGDYWAETYSFTTANGASFQPDKVFDWDGIADCWPGRRLNVTGVQYDPNRTYGAHQSTGSDVQSDELWSTPIYQSFVELRGQGVAREEVDKIVLESMFGLGSGFTMRELAIKTVATAKTLFPAGPHATVFEVNFRKLGILPDDQPTASIGATPADIPVSKQ